MLYSIPFLVHRTIAKQRNVLHRDMSFFNILIYPKWGDFDRLKFIEDRPPLIKDVLAGELRYARQLVWYALSGVDLRSRNAVDYQACCLLTDFDNAARLDDNTQPNELACRTVSRMARYLLG